MPVLQPAPSWCARAGAHSRRDFLRGVLAGAAGCCLPSPAAEPVPTESFSFLLLGDLHFDKLEHHDIGWLEKEKPDDLRQVRDYSRITAGLLPRLFAELRQVVAKASNGADVPAAFAAQIGDLVEGLCGNETLAKRQDFDALEFLRGAKLGIPFLFAKGNHDITGAGAQEAFKSVFHPFLVEEASKLSPRATFNDACCALDFRDNLFCFFDAYDRTSLGWLEAVLEKRTARHCFVLLHPPVVPYGARSTWHIYSAEKDKPQRERLLALLGQHNCFVLSGHIHKFNTLARVTPHGGRFVQFALSSVISSPEVLSKDMLSGVNEYNGDQIKVEPNFSPSTAAQRRAVYESEAPFIRYFEYADSPGFASVTVNDQAVTARVYSGLSGRLWRTLELAKLLLG